MKKRLLCAFLCAAMLMASSLPAFAESDVDELAGIKYESVADLQNCIQTHPAKHSDIPYLTSMNRLFIPEVLDGKLDEITEILITPTYVSVDFKANGQNFEFYHYPSGEYQYQLAQGRQKAQANKIYDFHPAKQKVNGYFVYSSYSIDTEYCWKQGEETFSLRVFDETNPKKRQNFSLCKATSIPLYEVVESDDPAVQKMAKKQEKVQFFVVDQNGKAVPDAQFVLPALQALVPTNASGKTWYYGKAFEAGTVTLYYTDSKGNNQYVTKTVTIRDKHLKNGKMSITFQVNV